jgi:hypothetical protein
VLIGIIDSFRAWRRGRDPLGDDDDEDAEDAGLGTERESPGAGPAHGR